jgi:hypothetical protein
MDKRKNFEKSEKLLKFAIENALGEKNSVTIDLDVDGSDPIRQIMIFILIDIEGDGYYQLKDLLFEFNRQKQIIENVLSHPKLQFQNDGSLGKNNGKINYLTEAGILSMNIDPDDFKISWHVMVEPRN